MEELSLLLTILNRRAAAVLVDFLLISRMEYNMTGKFQNLILAGLLAFGVAACSSTGTTTSDNLTPANGGGMAAKSAVEAGDSGTTASGNATAGAAGTATTTNSMGSSSSSATNSGTDATTNSTGAGATPTTDDTKR